MELFHWKSLCSTHRISSVPFVVRTSNILARKSKVQTSILHSNNLVSRINSNSRKYISSLTSVLKCRGHIALIMVMGVVLSFGPHLGSNFSYAEVLGSCKEGSPDVNVVRADEIPLTNEGIVEEAWRVVNENFFDARHHKWSPQSWLQMKEEVLSKPILTRSKAHELIQRMLNTLDDPYTRFLTPTEFKKMSRYDLSGIGINLKEVSDGNSMKLKVMGIILGGPAHSAGVKQGDEILSINGKSVKGMTSFEALSLIQGPKETFVSIEVKHTDCGPTETLTVQRTQTARTPIFYRLEKVGQGMDHIGYIRIKEFNSVAKRDLVIAMKRLKDGGASHFVLDLRDNPGGIVQAGIEIARLFLEDGQTVIYTVGRDPDSQDSILAHNAAILTTPLVILVNGQTASASEIVCFLFKPLCCEQH
eukprot:TRINITY_DN5691_c0_g1_i2.p1 TRINITY_DN5691_c0_g1~~TRINITY_DN5691_c0_g1_i2.p1  ORF type:complete len:418 (+),score=63.65 TRINITY_DN5691_c0_g1_i2:162-1415(+)